MEREARFFPPRALRALLARLRDANITTGRRAGALAIAGCLSGDAPLENGVRYALITPRAQRRVLEILADRDGLRLALPEDAVRPTRPPERIVPYEVTAAGFVRLLDPPFAIDPTANDAERIRELLLLLADAALANSTRALPRAEGA